VEVQDDLAGFACFFLQEMHLGTYLHKLYVDRLFRGNRLAPRFLIESIGRFQMSAAKNQVGGAWTELEERYGEDGQATGEPVCS
jgi:hypothetical protein